MTKGLGTASLLLGIGSAIVVFLLVLEAVPAPTYSSRIPTLPPALDRYAAVWGDQFNITSMSATYQEKIYVRATQKWNVSEPVTLRIDDLIAYNAGQRDPPPGPYNITIVPGLITLHPGSTIVFNATFIPWPNADDLYAFSDVTFMWEVGCISYPMDNPSNGIVLGAGYIFGVKGAGSLPPP
jgi:hypothetical protein